MKSHRNREQIILWITTLIAMVAMAVAGFTEHFGWFFGVMAGLFAVTGVLAIVFRLMLPKEQRRRDPRPWHKALFKLGRRWDRIIASVPDLQLIQAKGDRRLRQVERRGEFGIWAAQVEERDGTVTSYSETYQDSRTVTLDCGISRITDNSPFFPKGRWMKAVVDREETGSLSVPV